MSKTKTVPTVTAPAVEPAATPAPPQRPVALSYINDGRSRVYTFATPTGSPEVDEAAAKLAAAQERVPLLRNRVAELEAEVRRVEADERSGRVAALVGASDDELDAALEASTRGVPAVAQAEAALEGARRTLSEYIDATAALAAELGLLLNAHARTIVRVNARQATEVAAEMAGALATVHLKASELSHLLGLAEGLEKALDRKATAGESKEEPIYRLTEQATLPAFIHFAGLINNARGELLDITAGVAALNSVVDGKPAPEFDLDIA